MGPGVLALGEMAEPEDEVEDIAVPFKRRGPGAMMTTGPRAVGDAQTSVGSSTWFGK